MALGTFGLVCLSAALSLKGLPFGCAASGTALGGGACAVIGARWVQVDQRPQASRLPVAFGPGGDLATQHSLLSLLRTAVSIEPFEEQLSAGTTGLVKTLRYRLRRIARFVRWSVNRWAGWFGRGFMFALVALVAPLVDMALVVAWRDAGWRGVGRSALRGLIVYVGLLFDRRAPISGKLAMLVALAYCVASRDLLPDASFPIGALDDVLAVVLASRGFLLLCPEHLVEAHAIRAAGVNRGRLWRRAAV